MQGVKSVVHDMEVIRTGVNLQLLFPLLVNIIVIMVFDGILYKKFVTMYFLNGLDFFCL